MTGWRPSTPRNSCTRRRAVIRRYRASGSFLADLDALVIRTGVRAMELSRFGMDQDLARVDGYCTVEAGGTLIRDFHLIEDPQGNATLRVLSLIHISEPTRRTPISYAVFC